MRMSNALYVTDHRARISTSKSTLRVTGGDGETTRVPMASLESVVLLGHAQVTSQALAACVKKGIPVTSLARSGRVRFRVQGGTSGNVELRRAQLLATLDPDAKMSIARMCVAGKLQNARRAMQRWRWDADPRSRRMFERRIGHVEDRIAGIGRAPSADHLRGLEGEATRQYFRAMAAVLGRANVHFAARNRRPPRDPANALLSFTYSLVTSELAAALTAVGLDPQIGYLHEQRPGRPALALDLVEELRTGHADKFVVRAFTRRELTTDDFEEHPGGAVRLSDDGRRRMLKIYESFRDEEVEHGLFGRTMPRWAVPHAQATLLARHLRGDIAAYPPYVTR